jgi:hypothetical protein
MQENFMQEDFKEGFFICQIKFLAVSGKFSKFSCLVPFSLPYFSPSSVPCTSELPTFCTVAAHIRSTCSCFK